jgi:hypothetical protein
MGKNRCGKDLHPFLPPLKKGVSRMNTPMNTVIYERSNTFFTQFNRTITDMSLLSSALTFPSQTQEFEVLKNFDCDPITPEEELDLIRSHMDVINGRAVKFSAECSRDEVLKHLGLL